MQIEEGRRTGEPVTPHTYRRDKRPPLTGWAKKPRSRCHR